MKIAILSMYSGLVDRGVETWTRELAKRLTEKNDVLVLQGKQESFQPTYKNKIVNVKVIWKLRKGESKLTQYLTVTYWVLLLTSFSLRSLIYLIKFKPDIVIPTNGGIQTLLIKFYCLIFRCKLVIVGHAGIGAPEKWNLLMRPDLYIMPSIRGKKWARKLFFSKGINIINIPHGIDLEKFGKTDGKVKINLEKPIILCVASFDPFKRVDLAIRAVSKLEKGSLLIVGGDLASGKTKNLANRLLEKRYRIVKFKPEDMSSVYNTADVFTLPSNEFEAFGIVYLEALATNIPVVATDDDLRREIVGDAGILIDPTDIEAYAKALEKAYETNWGDRPRKQAMKFSWEKIVKMYEEEFENLLTK